MGQSEHGGKSRGCLPRGDGSTMFYLFAAALIPRREKCTKYSEIFFLNFSGESGHRIVMCHLDPREKEDKLNLLASTTLWNTYLLIYAHLPDTLK
jgi:hypothetical protein